ncbi:SDR family oxidoreductase [Streptomyces sp. NPDC090052]|uniref:SDR family oxidoreductase n=1 Tax=unclassified Streptomyces TaxID=2593676 RepID=UPI00224E2794|nr:MULTISPECIES: SDR family oxidoreductase [unclassified Streptomyces]MCX4729131.1 SDR family oxidoreductase [Streptomyces sp. NBC_01306]WSV08074.1 SDR family oxidoreductase [Streptomyces sp. NBC_01020]WSX46160.1 SDR family oxidoreductase [Streptomyces sp. NBC_00963]WSX65766.1 SDR family oxidoreductase [Streptomyces sp. NBC_00932]
MTFQNLNVVVTGASRHFGRALAIGFAHLGAEVYVSARTVEAAERTRTEVMGSARDRIHAFGCDLSKPADIREFARRVGERTDRVDLLVNNGARWLDGLELDDASDEEIVETIESTAGGTVLMVKHFLPLLRASNRPDIINMVAVCAGRSTADSHAHEAFYAAKGAQAGFADILSRRLGPSGVRVFSLYPPDFSTSDPRSAEWEGMGAGNRGVEEKLTTQALFECVVYAVEQPRDCFIRSFHFEPR